MIGYAVVFLLMYSLLGTVVLMILETKESTEVYLTISTWLAFWMALFLSVLP